MRIAIDARWIFPEISGIGAYTRALIRNLADIDAGNEYVLLFNNSSVLERTITETSLSTHPNFKTILLNFGLFSIKNQLLLPRILRKNKIDIYHSTNYMIPLPGFPAERPGRIKCVTTIHDVIPLIFPDHAPKSKKSRIFPIYRRLMIEIGRRADRIITDSKASRNDVIKHLRIPDRHTTKVHSIYCGVGEQFTPPPPENNRKPGQILYVGRIDPYKNVATLIRAVADVKTKHKQPVNLIIAGSPDPRYPDTHSLAEELGVSNSVSWTGYLSDQALLDLYRESTILVHPSRYEGFGLQIAEAMSCGTPVICANAGSQPEVAGDAAVLLDPDDLQGFSSNIIDIISNPRLADDLSRRGLAQAAGFTWRKTAENTLKVYESLS